MAKKSMILKQQAEPKFSSRRYNRCKICGRPHAYLRDYGVCRICFRELAYKGQIPGVRKRTIQIISQGNTLLIHYYFLPFTLRSAPPSSRDSSNLFYV